ncbi:hypothetical protein [Phenylobacterium sp.]|uniref:hypothetical protein n=1 Tax=Phenylobacterium sp. TaxID=1871053 RepID=UPI002FD9F6C6
MADETRSFDPDTAAANQTRQQGGGVGQKEMDAQRDPDRAVAASGRNTRDPEDPDNPEADWGGPATGAAYSATNTNRGDDPTRQLQGAKTRARTKEINSGGL